MTEDRAGQTATRHDWADIAAEHLGDLAERKRVVAQRIMVSRFVLEAGFHVEPHTHHNEQVSIVLEGRLRFTIGAIGSDEIREETLEAGQTMSIPPFVPHGATALERSIVLDLFSPPSEKTGVDQG
jgi:quercetin dioxygenase-like cupin family protein